MSDKEKHKVPWQISEAIGKIIAWVLIALLFIAFFGWGEMVDFSLTVAIPLVLFSTLIAYPISKYFNEKYSEIWFSCVCGLGVLVAIFQLID